MLAKRSAKIFVFLFIALAMVDQSLSDAKTTSKDLTETEKKTEKRKGEVAPPGGPADLQPSAS